MPLSKFDGESVEYSSKGAEGVVASDYHLDDYSEGILSEIYHIDSYVGMSLNATKTTAQIYEMAQNNNFLEMFKSFSSDLDELCLTPHQIDRFSIIYYNTLKTHDCELLFLSKKDYSIFPEGVDYMIVKVRMHGNRGLKANIFLWPTNNVGLGWIDTNERLFFVIPTKN